jgi:radical SAM protein with 4Fe4S-binding SPASM domain
MDDGELSTERALALLDEMAGLNPGWLIIEGGEPLLRQDIFTMLEKANRLGLEVYLITSGMLLSGQIIEKLSRLAVKVMISIDGATKATYEAIRPGANFEQVLEAARAASRAGLLAAINFTVLRKNYHEIPAITALAASLGKIKINFIGLKPCHNYQEELLTPGEYEAAVRLTCEAAARNGVEFFFDEPFFTAAVKEWGLELAVPGGGAGIVVPQKSACIFGDYLFIEPSGDVKPCSFARLVLGNVNDSSLGSIWEEAQKLPLLMGIRDLSKRTGHCLDCSHLQECLGCRSRTFALTGSWFASDPACPLAIKRRTPPCA